MVIKMKSNAAIGFKSIAALVWCDIGSGKSYLRRRAKPIPISAISPMTTTIKPINTIDELPLFVEVFAAGGRGGKRDRGGVVFRRATTTTPPLAYHPGSIQVETPVSKS